MAARRWSRVLWGPYTQLERTQVAPVGYLPPTRCNASLSHTAQRSPVRHRPRPAEPVPDRLPERVQSGAAQSQAVLSRTRCMGMSTGMLHGAWSSRAEPGPYTSAHLRSNSNLPGDLRLPTYCHGDLLLCELSKRHAATALGCTSQEKQSKGTRYLVVGRK